MMKNNLSLENWYDDADDLALGEVVKNTFVVEGKTLAQLKEFVSNLCLFEGENSQVIDFTFGDEGCEITLVREEQKEEEETL